MIERRKGNLQVKPAGVARIDWSHPFARHLLIAVCPGEGAGPVRDLVTGNTSIAGSQGGWATLKSGAGVKYTNAQYSVIPTRSLDVLKDGYTVLWGGQIGSAGSWDSWGGLFSLPSNSGAKSLIAVQRDTSSSNLQLFHNNIGGQTLSTTIQSVANTDLVLGIGWDGTSLREFRNGRGVLSTVPIHPPTGTPSNLLHINTERARSGKASQTLGFLYVFETRLPDDVVRSLSHDPFQILEQTRPLPFFRQQFPPEPSEDGELLPAPARQSQSAGQADIRIRFAVGPDDAFHRLQAGSLTLGQSHNLVAADAGHSHAVDVPRFYHDALTPATRRMLAVARSERTGMVGSRPGLLKPRKQ